MNVIYPLPIDSLEEKIGYTFKEKEILLRALTHSSYANELKTKHVIVENNERMEYLGDSVLSIVTSEYLFKHFPDMAEGLLSTVRAATVCEKALFEFAQKIELGNYMRLGHGDDNESGRNRPSILSDAFEALLCAIYIDGGIDSVKKFLLPYVIKKIDEVISKGMAIDYKTKLQELIQKEKGEILTYEIVSESGPDHNKTFETIAKLNSNIIGRGIASSKKASEQAAAKEALKLFGEESDE